MGIENRYGIDIGDRISFVGDSKGAETDQRPNDPSNASSSSSANHDVILPPHVAAMDAQLAKRVPNEKWTAKQS